MHLNINGEKRELKTSCTIAGMVQELGLDAPHFAIAVNFNVVPKSQYESTLIKEGDKVEIVHAVGGGV